MEIRVDARQVKGLAELWREAPQIVGAEVLAATRTADLLIQGELQQRLPRGAGGLSGGAGLVGSVFVEESAAGDRVIGLVASALPYAEYVEIGTRPHMPPVAPIEDWVAAKLGINDEAARRAVAFAIARKIAVRGTSPDGTWQSVAERSEPMVERLMAEAVDRALDRLGALQ
jgi:hypothetical protein